MSKRKATGWRHCPERRPPDMRWPDLAEREDAIANHLRLFQRSGAADLAPEHYTALRAQSEVLIDLARTAVFSAAAPEDLEALREGTVQFRQQVHLLQDSQSTLTQAGFGGSGGGNRSKVFLLILFLAARCFCCRLC